MHQRLQQQQHHSQPFKQYMLFLHLQIVVNLLLMAPKSREEKRRTNVFERNLCSFVESVAYIRELLVQGKLACGVSVKGKIQIPEHLTQKKRSKSLLESSSSYLDHTPICSK